MINPLIQPFLDTVADKTIHIVGVSGAEGSTLAAFFIKYGLASRIVAHDFVESQQFRDTFFFYHDWMDEAEKETSLQSLTGSGMRFHFKEAYLTDIGEEDILFVPQSWFRYDFNAPLLPYFDANHRLLDTYVDRVYSLSRLYLELFPGNTIGVTGTKGKSTTTALIAAILKTSFATTLGEKRLFWGATTGKIPNR